MLNIAYVNTGYGDTSIEEKRIQEAGMRLTEFTDLSPEDWGHALADADAVVVTLEKITSHMIGSLPNLKVIGRMGVGVDSIDLEAAGERGIPVINIPDYCIEEVALQAVSLALAAHRKLVPAHDLVRSGQWSSASLKPIPALSGLTFGLLGMGRIGRKVIDYMRPFVGRILVHDPFVDPASLPEHVELANQERLFGESDILSLHCPLTADTKHIIRLETMRLMKKQPILVNVSRGALVHEQELVAALDDGIIRCAALDVLEQEPPSPDHPLLDHPKALVTNHIAWYSAESEIRLRELSVARVIDYLQGREVPTIANRAALRS